MCSAQTRLQAAAYCSVCRLPFSGRFLAVRLDGRAICHACSDREQIPTEQARGPEPRDPVFRDGWRHTLLVVLARPAELVRPWHGPVGHAWWRGLGWSWLGLGAGLGWSLALGRLPWEQVQAALPEAARAQGWVTLALVGATLVLALLRQTVGPWLMHAGLRLAGASAEQWTLHVRVFSALSVVRVLAMLPLLGGPLSALLFVWAMLTFAGLSYGLARWRAMLALAPCLLWTLLFDLQ
jgi:hypothetical protein